jgi:hypothetical protein
MSVFLVFCQKENHSIISPSIELNMNNKINVKVGNKTFTATLLDNATSKAFVAQLPLTINMVELNNNEKYAQLPKSVPINASVPSRIEAGDLMMYGSSTLVLFYKGFNTSYSYTKIGKIDDVTGLTTALGAGDVQVSFEVK